jgi:PAS domain S-box-containing protein
MQSEGREGGPGSRTSPGSKSNPQNAAQEMNDRKLPASHFSPLRLLVTIIGGIFIAEVVAMIVVYFLKPASYMLLTLVDAGIMTVLIFPLHLFLFFRPLLLSIEKSQRAEVALLRSLEVQEKFFDSIDTLIAYMDRDFNFIRVNEAYAKADGKTPEEFIGRNHFDLFPHRENQAIYRRVLETGEAYSVYEKPFAYPDHPERGITYWNWSLQPVKGSGGQVEGLVLSLVDVTERVRAEDKNQQLSRIVEQTGDTVVVTDYDGVIEYVNPAFEEITGFTLEEVQGKTPRVLKSGLHDDLFYKGLWSTILSGEIFQGEIPNRKKNGDLFYEVKTITPLRDERGDITHFVGTGKDITAHKQAEKELQKAYDQLELRVQERTEELRIANSELAEEINERVRAEAEIQRAAKEILAANEELKRFNTLMVGRELRMIELKKEVNELCALANQPRRYPLAFEKEREN